MYDPVRYRGQRLAEAVRQVGGRRTQTAAQAAKRFGTAPAKDAARRRFIAELKQ